MFTSLFDHKKTLNRNTNDQLMIGQKSTFTKLMQYNFSTLNKHKIIKTKTELLKAVYIKRPCCQKMAPLRLQRLINDANQDHERLVETVAVVEPAKAKVTTATQTKVFAFAGNPKGVADTPTFDKHS